MKTETPHPTEERPTIQDAAVVAWRRKQLLARGFSLAVAEDLARNCAVDLHALTELVERGCPPKLVARIVAPLVDEARAC